jgi:hypothetical protein
MAFGKSANTVSRDENPVLSNLPPSSAQQKLALVVALLIVLPALLISVTGMQQVKLAAIDALVPLYGMAMFVTRHLAGSYRNRWASQYERRSTDNVCPLPSEPFNVGKMSLTSMYE